MKLSEFSADAELIRDAEFSKLGYVDTPVDGLLAYADTLKYVLKARENPGLSCLITTPELASQADCFAGLVIANNPRILFYKIHQHFISANLYRLPFEPGIGSGCLIHPSASIAPGCRIGDNVKIAEQVLIRDAVWIGSNVTIEPGVKLGMEGILYTKNDNGMHLIPHGGYVHIHDHVTLMTNAVVVRSIHDTDVTEIGRGSLIGLGTIVGHEAKVGESVVVSNQCVLARRSVIAKNAFIGTQVMVKENVKIAENARVMTGSVVIDDVDEGDIVSGNFATNHKFRMLELFRLNKRSLNPKK